MDVLGLLDSAENAPPPGVESDLDLCPAPCSAESSSSQPDTSITSYKPASTNQWDPRLMMDLALGLEDLQEVLARYQLTEQEYNRLCTIPSFKQELLLTIRDVQADGVTFQRKAKIQAEAYLDILDDLVYDEDMVGSTRLSAIQSIVKWAGLEPKETKEDNTVATQVNVNISF